MPNDAPSRGLETHDHADEQPTRSHVDGGMSTWSAPSGAGPTGLPRLPGYVVEGELGRGGMGVVYQARHLKLNRSAALKMILGDGGADPKALIRFLAEAEAAAAIDHPHVVRVYEVGESDGRPVLALELCPGGTLADRLKAGRLAPRAAAELMQKLAAGVGAAHALGIVHRDLKPGNVLFDAEGEPKVADFGLAKRGGGADLTKTNVVMGSPAYMAPEQAKGESKFVGPQADVWALGVILYECLTGIRPFHAEDSWALLHLVMAAEPAGVRTVSREVPRDLDLVCRKCLAKAPHERYATAAELADDLGRFLTGKPTVARPAGWAERAWKGAKRNKPLVAVMAALVLGMVGTTLGLIRAQDEAEKARVAEERATTEAARALDREKAAYTERESAEEVTRFMKEVFSQAGAMGQLAPGRKVTPSLTVKEAMDYAVANLDGRFADRPDIEAVVRNTVGDTYRELGYLREARPQLERSLAGFRGALGDLHPDTLHCLTSLGILYTAQGEYAKAEPLLREAVDGLRSVRGGEHKDTLSAVTGLAEVYKAGRKYAEAEPLFLEALTGRRKTLGNDHRDTSNAANNLGLLYWYQNRPDEAEPLLREAVAGYRKVRGPGHPDTLASVNNLALVCQALGKYEEAEPLFREALAGLRAARGNDHPDTLASVVSLGVFYSAQGKHAEAEPLLREDLAGLRAAHGNDHPDTILSANNVGHILIHLERPGEAIPLLQESLRGIEKRPELAAYGPATQVLLGVALAATGKPAEAEPQFLATYDALIRKPPGTQARKRLRQAAQGLIEVYESTNQPAKAAQWRAKLAALPPEVAPRPRPAK